MFSTLKQAGQQEAFFEKELWLTKSCFFSFRWWKLEMPCLLSQRKYSFHVPLNPCRVYVTVKTSSRFPGGLDVLRSPHSALSHQHFQLKFFNILESDEELLLVSFSFPEVEKVWHAWRLEWGMLMKSYYHANKFFGKVKLKESFRAASNWMEHCRQSDKHAAGA